MNTTTHRRTTYQEGTSRWGGYPLRNQWRVRCLATCPHHSAIRAAGRAEPCGRRSSPLGHLKTHNSHLVSQSSRW
jgi:hypothetical protein